jgi:hypothetical protein
MDPPGFALESFDVMGGVTDIAVKEGAKPAGLGRWRGVRLFLCARWTAQEKFPMAARSGRSRFQAPALEDDTPIARNLVKQLAVYHGVASAFQTATRLKKFCGEPRPGNTACARSFTSVQVIC